VQVLYMLAMAFEGALRTAAAEVPSSGAPLASKGSFSRQTASMPHRAVRQRNGPANIRRHDDDLQHCELTACPNLTKVYPRTMPMKSKSRIAGSTYCASKCTGTNMIPSPAVGYCIQKTPRMPKSAPEAPPHRTNISGMTLFWVGINVARCWA